MAMSNAPAPGRNCFPIPTITGPPLT